MKQWAGVGAAYAASYAALCAGTGERMREILGPAQEQSLLDVGSGDGTLASAWAAAGWRVTACEPEPTMRAESERRHPSCTVVDAALPHLPFRDAAFDAVVANFVLNHVADPRAAATELLRVCRGTVLATIWTRSPSWFWAEIVERAGLEPTEGERLPADKDFERTADGFAIMLREAGMCTVTVEEWTWTWAVDPAALWISIEGGVAGAGARYAGLGVSERERFRRAFEAVVDARAERGVLMLDHRAAIAAAAAS